MATVQICDHCGDRERLELITVSVGPVQFNRNYCADCVIGLAVVLEAYDPDAGRALVASRQQRTRRATA